MAQIVTKCAQGWPREIFDILDGRRLPESIRKLLRDPGVYILYKHEAPYYVGKTGRPLFNRIWDHANATRDKWYGFWTHFSAFIVKNADQRTEVESILIAAMPTANSAAPRITPMQLPREITRALARPKIRINSD